MRCNDHRLIATLAAVAWLGLPMTTPAVAGEWHAGGYVRQASPPGTVDITSCGDPQRAGAADRTPRRADADPPLLEGPYRGPDPRADSALLHRTACRSL